MMTQPPDDLALDDLIACLLESEEDGFPLAGDRPAASAETAPGSSGVPPEIGDWLNGCFKLEPDGTITPKMDLSLDPLDFPNVTVPRGPSPLAPPKSRKERSHPSVLLLKAAVILFCLVSLCYGIGLLDNYRGSGLRFFPVPDGLHDGQLRGALIAAKLTDPDRIRLGEDVVYLVPDGGPALRKVVGISARGGRSLFQLRLPGRQDEYTGAVVGPVTGAFPVLGVLSRLVRNCFLLSLPAVLLLVSVAWRLLSGVNASHGIRLQTRAAGREQE